MGNMSCLSPSFEHDFSQTTQRSLLTGLEQAAWWQRREKDGAALPMASLGSCLSPVFHIGILNYSEKTKGGWDFLSLNAGHFLSPIPAKIPSVLLVMGKDF
jgi:hypothetical protein